VLYLPVPPPRKIIEKRIEFLEKKLLIDQTTKGKYFLGRGIKLDIPNLEKFVKYLQKVFLANDHVARWIGDFSNYDIRRCLDITRDVIASPHLPLEDLFKVWVSGKLQSNNEFEVKRYKIKNALLKRTYNSYPINNHPYIQNLYFITGNINTTPLLAIRILALLMDRKNEEKEDNYLIIDQILDYFNGMGLDRSITTKHLDLMLKKGLLYSYDPTVIDINDSKRIEISPSGGEHFFWGLNDVDYLYVMMEVTPISDRDTFYSIKEKFYDRNERSRSMLDFLNWITSEDKIFCHVPKHEAYLGQAKVLETLESKKKKIMEWEKKH
jgi:hypothetical protein